MLDYLKFAMPKRVTHRALLYDKFCVTDRGKYMWLQRICCWILKKLGAFYEEVYDVCYTETIDKKKFVDAFMDQKSVLMHEWHLTPGKIICGEKDFCEIMGYKHSFDLMPINVEFNIELADNERDVIFGVPVQVVPWLDGMIILPKEEPQKLDSPSQTRYRRRLPHGYF